MTPLAVTYLLYLMTSLLITVWVGQTLFRYGRTFLVDVFCGDVTIADAVNRLLLAGYYLTNIALDLFLLKTKLQVQTWLDVFELLNRKVGTVLIVLGGMHFLNVLVLQAIHQYRKAHEARNSVGRLDVVEFLDE